MAEAIKSRPTKSVWVVATGTLTNVAALFRKEPELIDRIRGLSIMGGSIGGGFSDAPMGQVDGKARIGNFTPHAEFNILVDPEAASEIFSNKTLAAKLTMVPLDLSHQVLATAEVRELLLNGKGGDKSTDGKTTMRKMFVELLYFFAQTYTDVFGISAGPPLHDPLAVAAILTGAADEIKFSEWDAAKSSQPEHAERFKVDVVTEGTFDEARNGKETGRTLAEELAPGEPGVRIPRGMDVAKFWDVIEMCLQRADEANELSSR